MASTVPCISAESQVVSENNTGYQPIRTLIVPVFQKLLRCPPWKWDLWNYVESDATELTPKLLLLEVCQCLFPLLHFPSCHTYWLHIHNINHFWHKTLNSLQNSLFFPINAMLLAAKEQKNMSAIKSVDIITSINHFVLSVLLSTLFLSKQHLLCFHLWSY